MKNFPDSILLSKESELGEILDDWCIIPKTNDESVEYVRTDVFIKKAEGWLREIQKGFILTDKDIVDFVNYMKEK